MFVCFRKYLPPLPLLKAVYNQNTQNKVLAARKTDPSFVKISRCPQSKALKLNKGFHEAFHQEISTF